MLCKCRFHKDHLGTAVGHTMQRIRKDIKERCSTGENKHTRKFTVEIPVEANCLQKSLEVRFMFMFYVT